jgi:glutamine synthetase
MADAKLPVFGVPHGFKADPTQVSSLKSRLVDAGVKSCFATFVDVHGIPKSKQTPIDAFEHLCDGSELNTVGACEGLGLAGPHQHECATVPDMTSAVVLPWDKTRAWFSSDLYYHGEPYAGDPRGILRRVLARAEQHGFRFNLGIASHNIVCGSVVASLSPRLLVLADARRAAARGGARVRGGLLDLGAARPGANR